MSIRVSASALKNAVAIVGVIAGAGTLAGCSSFGSRPFGDPVTTGSTSMMPSSNLSQPMPQSLGAPTQTAMNEFLPPENVGGFSTQPILGQSQPMQNMQTQTLPPLAPVGGSSPTVSTTSLPPLGSTQPTGTPIVMPAAQPSLATSPVVPPTMTAPQTLAPADSNASGTHVIQSGESLYTIARQYNVTTQAIVQANNLASPDRITVGQSIIIPGRPGATSQQTAQTLQPLPQTQQQSPAQQVAAVQPQPTAVTPMMPPAHTSTQTTPTTQVAQPTTTPATTTPVATTQPAPTQQVATTTQPTQQAAAPVQEAAASDDFRWPVSGRVITDFAASRGTGINIEVPEGTTVRAAEAGSVIYVGSGVEGYGNLILVRHSNGYVSAYAHLKSMSVEKGATVARGDAIGQSGQSGSVTRPQLHFELRRGATPVDPIPLLAG